MLPSVAQQCGNVSMLYVLRADVREQRLCYDALCSTQHVEMCCNSSKAVLRCAVQHSRVEMRQQSIVATQSAAMPC